MDDMIGRTWAEWEESLADSDAAFGESEAEYADYRETVGRETPDLRLEHDIKSECSGVYETELVRCDWCGVAFKLCHLRHHVQLRHPEMPEMKYTPPTPTFDVTSMHRGTIKKEPTMASSRPTATTTTTSTSNDQFNNNLKVKKRAASPTTTTSTTAPTGGNESNKRVKKEKDERNSIFFSRRENPVVIFGQCDSEEGEEALETTTQHRNYINHYMPLAYPRYGCYVDKNAKMHAYSSASRNLNQKLQLLQSPILQEPNEFDSGSSPMTPLSQPSPNLPPRKLATHVRVQH